MAINVNIMLYRKHDIVKHGGLVSAAPALEGAGRLYVIKNTSTSRPVYIGTASNLRNRFTARIKAIREFGFANLAINPIRIHVYRVFVDGHARPPNDLGIAGGVDVEHLLIRLHMAQGINVRNITKTAPFTNTSGHRINLTLTANAPLNVPNYLGGAGIAVAIANGASY